MTRTCRGRMLGVVVLFASCSQDRIQGLEPSESSPPHLIGSRRAGEGADRGPARAPVVERVRPIARRPVAFDATSIAVLKEALASPDLAVRMIAIEALGDLRSELGVVWLEHALGDPEHDVRLAAVEALGRIESPRALTALASVRDDTSETLDLRALAASALLTQAHTPREECR